MTAAVTSKAPLPIEIARRSLDDFDGVSIIREFVYDDELDAWVLHVRLSPADLAFSDFVPSSTEWFISVDATYPVGQIDFYPARENGITCTFPHQARNADAANLQWRKGKICVGDQYSIFEDRFISDEPITAEDRLRWHVKRGLEWLEFASRDELLPRGSYFELPAFPSDGSRFKLIAFDGSTENFEQWSGQSTISGFFEYLSSRDDHKVALVNRFLGPNGKRPIVGSDFGDLPGFQKTKSRGVWIRIPRLPVVAPWAAPGTWNELCDVLERQAVDLIAEIERVLSNRRRAEDVVMVAMLGFPVVDRIGDEPKRYHWIAMNLPDAFSASAKLSGFRTAARHGNPLAIRTLVGPEKVEWVNSENWASDQLSSRGSLPPSVTRKNILLIGAGALGSSVAEMLVRGGAYRLNVVDGDDLQAGNLVRHTLDLSAVTKNKAAALARHLNAISPWATVTPIRGHFSSRADLGEYDLVIDCTGMRKVQADLARIFSADSKIFISVSMSFAARRLYFYFTQRSGFPFERFNEHLRPWLEKDGGENVGIDAPREGVGCWHPVFPARSDDLWLWGATAVKLIARACAANETETFRVYEQTPAEFEFSIRESQL